MSTDKDDKGPVNLATLTDDEIMNLDPTEFPEDEEEEKKDDTPEPDNDPAEDQSADDDEEEVDDTVDPGGADTVDEPSDNDDDGAGDASAEEDEETGNEEDDPDDPGKEDEADQASTDSSEEKGEVTDSSDEIDYKAELAKILAPFKAAKRNIKVETPEDARRLMQMGVDYSRKMEAMKPYQKVLKTLERNNLLDIEKVNFMIDLDKKNPEAIKKFLKDSEIDPIDLNLEDDSNGYKPTDHMVGDDELAINAVIESIKETDTFDRTVDVITNQWDSASRRLLLQDPSVISIINDHVEAGIYDMIADRLATERIFGKHTGLSDLDAYKAVGDAMQEEGAFGKAPAPEATPPNGDATQDSQDLNGSSSESDEEKSRKARKQAASPPKGKAATEKKVPNFAKFTDEQISEFDINSL